MKPLKHYDRRTPIRGFTLIEVILAVGILATSILAIIAFLGATAQATSDVIDRSAASRIADNLRAELENEDLDDLFDAADPGDPIFLYATSDGERVRLGGPNGNVDEPEENGNPPGIAERNRFFRIEVSRLENSLEFTNSVEFQESAMLPLSVQLVWPHQRPTGGPDNPNAYVSGSPEEQSRYVFNTVILRKQ